VDMLRSQQIDDEVQRHQIRTAFRLACHLQRIDVELVRLFQLHNLRAPMLLGPPGSAMTGGFHRWLRQVGHNGR